MKLQIYFYYEKNDKKEKERKKINFIKKKLN